MFFENYVLDNGLKLKIYKKKGFNQKNMYLAVNYGSIDYKFLFDGQKIETTPGIAHFLEHKMFSMPYGDAYNKLTSLGASSNAYTTKEKTVYYATCVSNFYSVLETFLDFIFTKFFDSKSIENEKGIIINEINMARDNKYFSFQQDLSANTYSSSTFVDDIAGTEKDVIRTTKEMLEVSYDAFYTPENMSLMLGGDIPSTIVTYLNDYFKKFNFKKHKVERLDGLKESKILKHDFSTYGETNVPYFVYEQVLPTNLTLKDVAVLSVTLDLLFTDFNPLIEELKDKEIIESSFDYSFSVGHRIANFTISGFSHKIEGIKVAINYVIENSIITEEHLRLVKKTFVSDYIRNLDKPDRVCDNNVDDVFNSYDSNKELELIENVSKEDVSHCISNIKENKNRVFGVFDKEKK